MRAFILSTVALATLALASPALSQDKPYAGQTIVVLMPSPAQPDIAAFEAETGIKVDLQTTPWDDIRPRLVTALVAGTSPADVTEFDWSWTGQFSAANWFVDLSSALDDETKSDIKGISVFTVDGKILGVPWSNDFRLTVINKQHFADAGVTSIPKTLDELVAAAKQIKAKGVSQYPIALPLSTTEGASTAWYLMTKAFGGDLFDDKWNPLFLTPDSAGYKAMAFEVQLLKDGLVDPAATGLRDEQTDALFSSGQASINLSTGPGGLGALNNPDTSKIAGNAQAILVPTVSGTTRSYGLLEALGVPSTSEHKEAAIEFIKWFTGKEVQAQYYMSKGILPTRTSALDELNQDAKLQSGDTVVAQSKYIEAIFPAGTPTWYPEFSSAVNTALNAVAKDQITVDVAMQNIADAAKKAMSQ